MLSPFLLQQPGQSRALLLLLLPQCPGRGARCAARTGAAIGKGFRSRAATTTSSSGARSHCSGGVSCAAARGWPEPRFGVLRGLRTSVSGDGTTRNEARRFNSSDGKKLSKSQQLKQVFKEYGAVGVVFHVGISLTSLGIFYLVVSSGVDVAALLYKMGFSEAVVQSRMAAGTSTFVLAYAVHKVFAPVRMSITLISVPLIVRYFRKIGLFKASTSKP
ncbi:protein FAM210B, mitochondrial [Chiloscyllium plagiosum]|uniref:protein FAM210B, mitochondrial n=1 Tax=Chiloscyllium plagiosum TaxID=36176 RepID=UPI001CB86025|nr:protein FAM210B, mitochondrial [Chiloscyllium plagiosum]